MFKDKITKDFNKQIANIREEHKEEIELLGTDWENKKRISLI